LVVDGGAGTDTLNIDNTGDVSAAVLILDSGHVGGLGMAEGIDYSSIEVLNVGLGSGPNTLNIRGVSAATTLNGGAGDDLFIVGSLAPDFGGTVNNIQAQLTLNGRGGNDTLLVDDSGDTEANEGTLTATTLTGLGMTGGITYGTMEAVEVFLGSGGNTFAVTSTIR